MSHLSSKSCSTQSSFLKTCTILIQISNFSCFTECMCVKREYLLDETTGNIPIAPLDVQKYTVCCKNRQAYTLNQQPGFTSSEMPISCKRKEIRWIKILIFMEVCRFLFWEEIVSDEVKILYFYTILPTVVSQVPLVNQKLPTK